MKRKIGFLLIFVFMSAVLGMVQGLSFTINSTNAVIVLPTTKIVNGQPLHIGEDAISGSRLGALLVLKGIRPSIYTTYVNVDVEYHSILIKDNDQYYKLNRTDMPDVGLNVGDSPVGDVVVIALNFSRVFYNDTIKKAQFNDRAIEIIFNENTTPLSLGGEDTKMVSTVIDNKDTLYIYSYKKVLEESKTLGETLSVNGWKIKFMDIDTEQKRTLTDVLFPSGLPLTKVFEKGKYYLFYIDAENDEDVETYDSYPENRILDLQKAGAKKIFVFTPTDFFVGIGGTKQVSYTYEYFEKTKKYMDGDIFEDQWVWDIDPEDSLFTLYLHVDPENGFPKVTLGEDDVLGLPVDKLKLTASFTKDDEGKITGVEGYTFVRSKTVKRKVTVQTTKAEVIDDVNDLIIEDTGLTSLPNNKHVIIVGGWVSNKAWNLLEQVYGSDMIGALKEEVMSKGYVIKILENPNNPAYKVIILAGKDYTLTRKAIEEFMNQL